jgi:chemotaxis protein methyltransferase CheR
VDSSFREFAFTDDHFNRLRCLVNLHAGISVSDSKRELIYSRLSRRLRHLGMDNFEGYCRMLEEGDACEVPQFVNAITTNLTSFFRESHHFDYLADKVLPGLMERKSKTRQLRIWSAGCSTGEEPYSIAIVIRECLKNIDEWDIKILATDIDSNVLEMAEKGIYPDEKINGLSLDRLQTSFRKGIGSNLGFVKIVPKLKQMISFRQLNLMDSWPMRGLFDIIFCRNVVIYFNKQRQKILFDRFSDSLDPKGFLFVGHSESLFDICKKFDLVGKTIYIRRK